MLVIVGKIGVVNGKGVMMCVWCDLSVVGFRN